MAAGSSAPTAWRSCPDVSAAGLARRSFSMDLHALTAAPFDNDAAVSMLLAAFYAGTLPRSAWNHRAHLTVALTVARTVPDCDAIATMRAAILRFNAAAGIESTPDSGYHDTLTVFYMAIVARDAPRLRPLVARSDARRRCAPAAPATGPGDATAPLASRWRAVRHGMPWSPARIRHPRAIRSAPIRCIS